VFLPFEAVSDALLALSDFKSETILYSASSQAPKSINLHRFEQKGKNFPALASCMSGALMILWHTGHLRFMAKC